jgi:hypothetical protein
MHEPLDFGFVCGKMACWKVPEYAFLILSDLCVKKDRLIAMITKRKNDRSKRYWSHKVTKQSDALDLESGVFTWKNPKRIAQSLKRSAERSKRRKAKPFQSAMSMLNFYLNRAGTKLPGGQKKILTQAKTELRKLFGKDQTQ